MASANYLHQIESEVLCITCTDAKRRQRNASQATNPSAQSTYADTCEHGAVSAPFPARQAVEGEIATQKANVLRGRQGVGRKLRQQYEAGDKQGNADRNAH